MAWSPEPRTLKGDPAEDETITTSTRISQAEEMGNIAFLLSLGSELDAAEQAPLHLSGHLLHQAAGHPPDQPL